MAQLIAGVALFFGTHSIAIIRPGMRERMIARIGAGPWRLAYTIVSLAGLVLIVKGYSAARLYPAYFYLPPYWMRHVVPILLLPVFPLLLAAYFPGRIRNVVAHPMLAGTALWALSHLLVNGTLADVLLFGSFLLWAIALRSRLKRSPARKIPGAPASDRNDVIAIVAGLAIYALFAFWAHSALFGVPPLSW